jgi:hypothetical protein
MVEGACNSVSSGGNSGIYGSHFSLRRVKQVETGEIK